MLLYIYHIDLGLFLVQSTNLLDECVLMINCKMLYRKDPPGAL